MAIEIKQKPKKEKGALIKYSLYIGVAFLLLMAVGYAFLYFSVNNAEGKLADLKDQSEQQMSEENKQLQQRIVQTQKQLERSSQVINSHRSVYNFFNILASVTHPHLKFTQVDFSAETNKVVLEGITESFTTLSQQVDKLQEDDHIRRAEIERASVESGAKVDFKIILTLNSEAFEFPPQE